MMKVTKLIKLYKNNIFILGLIAALTISCLLTNNRLTFINSHCLKLSRQISAKQCQINKIRNRTATLILESNPVNMIAKSMQSVVTIHTSFYEGHIASGFYIGNGIIVTAGHVAEMEIEKVIFEDGAEYKAIRQIKHSDYDCGFILIEDCNRPTLTFDTADIRRGEEIFILGHPGGETFISTRGIIAGRTNRKLFGETSLIVIDGTAWAGSSGSVVLGIKGKVQGVHVGWIINNGNYGVSICAKEILKALNAAGLKIE